MCLKPSSYENDQCPFGRAATAPRTLVEEAGLAIGESWTPDDLPFPYIFVPLHKEFPPFSGSTKYSGALPLNSI